MLNGRTNSWSGSQDNDFWTIDNDMGIHYESRGYSLDRNYRVVLYLKDDTILSGNGSLSTPYNVEEDWAWFDSYQVVN